jgi:hypothetical protein
VAHDLQLQTLHSLNVLLDCANFCGTAVAAALIIIVFLAGPASQRAVLIVAASPLVKFQSALERRYALGTSTTWAGCAVSYNWIPANGLNGSGGSEAVVAL